KIHWPWHAHDVADHEVVRAESPSQPRGVYWIRVLRTTSILSEQRVGIDAAPPRPAIELGREQDGHLVAGNFRGAFPSNHEWEDRHGRRAASSCRVHGERVSSRCP